MMKENDTHTAFAFQREALRAALSRRKMMCETFRFPCKRDNIVMAIAEAIRIEVEWRRREYLFPDHLHSQLDQLADWLTGASRKTGVILCGNGIYGNGKTTIIRALQNLVSLSNMKRDDGCNNSGCWSLAVKSAREITSLARTDIDEWRCLSLVPMLAIDDLGAEPNESVADAGSVLPITDLLTCRYNNLLFTIIATNLTMEQLCERYGQQMADRLNEMMEVIIFDNPSYRNLSANNTNQTKSI